MATPTDDAVVEDGVLKSLCGYTWPGIEWGEPPGPRHTFFEYIDAVRADDVARVRAIEAVDAPWWTPTLDRGGGAALHFAADAGAVASARHLLDRRRVPVNQRDGVDGATPLHRAAAVAHHADTNALAVFDLLLARGADPDARTRGGMSVLDAAVAVGHGWPPGRVRVLLAASIADAASVPKRPLVPAPTARVAAPGARLLAAWRARPADARPPPGWRPPPPAGWSGAQGVRVVTDSGDGWRPAGSPGDGWARVRPATDADAAAAAAAVAVVAAGGGG